MIREREKGEHEMVVKAGKIRVSAAIEKLNYYPVKQAADLIGHDMTGLVNDMFAVLSYHLRFVDCRDAQAVKNCIDDFFVNCRRRWIE